ncbi:MAG TPA: FAD-binding oxidoreductase [Chitinophagaceae bacterium]|jgi:glycine/D-amino acid oxidase-like deaminating enzyme|nr:FAD-binding oxidoreductase [Chitinophagaceae bacterium]
MTNNSIWEIETYYKAQDVVIVGAGLMGLWTALTLHQKMPTLGITILEKNTTPLGASTRNAGFACFGSPTELLSDASSMGENNMWQLVEKRYKGIEKIKKTFHSTVTDYSACGGFECLLNKDEQVLEQLDWLNKGMSQIVGSPKCFTIENDLLEKNQLTGFDYLIQNNLEGTLHSGKLVQALTQKVIAAGITILYGVEVNHCVDANNTVKVSFNQNTITAKQLIFCTNAFTNKLINKDAIVPARGQVIVTSPIENLTLNGSFHFDEGFYYWRNLGNRILLGGARNKDIAGEETTELTTSITIQNELELFLKTHISSTYQYTIEHKWSGIMAFTNTKTPVCKKISENVYYAIACNGMGVALTPIFAEELVNKIFNTQ